MKKNEQGLFIVEFAIIAAALFVVLFAVMELARIIWVWNTADEATRRGARVAAVCPIDDTAVECVTVFADPDCGSLGNSPILRGLSTSNVTVSYLNGDGDVLNPPTFDDTRYVRVSLSGYSITPLIPFIDTTFTLPPFETTIPSESLGLVPNPDNPTAAPRFDCLMP